jgi:hypothetical protein
MPRASGIKHRVASPRNIKGLSGSSGQITQKLGGAT